MKKLYICLITFLTIISSSNLLAQNWLWIQNPQTWQGGQGTIKEVVISAKPCGMYVEYGLYLTFSPRGLGFSPDEQLEVQFGFDLPDEAIVTDLWLWVYDDIMRARIMDVWKASTIYEDIVDRRKDPAILFKRNDPWNNNTNYELRIYPLLGEETRKVKLTFLMPAYWYGENISAAIPSILFNTSKYPIEKCELLFYSNNEWLNPAISEFPEITFIEKSDDEKGIYSEADITDYINGSGLTLNFDSPIKDGFYLSHFYSSPDGSEPSLENEGYYQLAILPSKFLTEKKTKKVSILIEYNEQKTTVSYEMLLNRIQGYLKENFSEVDSLNIIFSGLQIKRFSDTWISADNKNIDSLFSRLREQSLTNYSNLPALFQNGIEFINNEGGDASILLFSSSDQYGDRNAANGLINDMLEAMQFKTAISIADINNNNYIYHYIGNQSYIGNEYLYANLARLTGGEFHNIRSGQNLGELISRVFNSLDSFIGSFDLHTGMTNGFCYGRYSSFDNRSISLNEPILQMGKFFGDFPFKLNAAGIYNDEVFAIESEINQDQSVKTDSLNEVSWFGRYILDLEKRDQSNNVTGEIISTSIKERILSIYTAFLALEPDDSTTPCLDCFDETDLVDIGEENLVDEEKPDSLEISAYPNPFNAEVTINVVIPENSLFTQNTFKIYNMLGQEVRSFDYTGTDNKSYLEFFWDARNDNGERVSSGIYFFIVTTPTERQTLKLLMIK